MYVRITNSFPRRLAFSMSHTYFFIIPKAYLVITYPAPVYCRGLSILFVYLSVQYGKSGYCSISYLPVIHVIHLSFALNGDENIHTRTYLSETCIHIFTITHIESYRLLNKTT